MRYLVNPGTSVNLLNDFDKVLDSFFDNSKEIDFQNPAVDVREEEDKYVLEADLPGLTEKDIDVKVDDKLLTVSSVKKEKSYSILLHAVITTPQSSLEWRICR